MDHEEHEGLEEKQKNGGTIQPGKAGSGCDSFQESCLKTCVSNVSKTWPPEEPPEAQEAEQFRKMQHICGGAAFMLFISFMVMLLFLCETNLRRADCEIKPTHSMSLFYVVPRATTAIALHKSRQSIQAQARPSNYAPPP